MVKTSDSDCFFADTWEEGELRSGNGATVSEDSKTFSFGSWGFISAIFIR